MRRRITRGPGSARGLAAAAAACSAALVLAACGSAGGTASGTASPGTSPTVGAEAPCAASALKVRVDFAAEGVAAGTDYDPIDVTSAAAASCRLDGYPGAWFGTGDGHRIGVSAARDTAVAARPVQLLPGGTAHAWLEIADAANYPAATCHPVTVHWLLIHVPGVATVVAVRHTFLTCAAAMDGRGIITVQPLAAGPGRRGSA
jgi:uncharacterized protein DUF4232